MDEYQSVSAQNSAGAIRQCLSYLLADALESELHLPALHIKLAIMELDDLIGCEHIEQDIQPEEDERILESLAAE